MLTATLVQGLLIRNRWRNNPLRTTQKIHYAKFGVEGYSGSSKQAVFYLDINWETERRGPSTWKWYLVTNIPM